MFVPLPGHAMRVCVLQHGSSHHSGVQGTVWAGVVGVSVAALTIISAASVASCCLVSYLGSSSFQTAGDKANITPRRLLLLNARL